MATPTPNAPEHFFGCHLDLEAAIDAGLSEHQAFTVLSHHAGTHLIGVRRATRRLEEAAGMIGQLLAIIQKQAAGDMLSAEQMESLSAGIQEYEAQLLDEAKVSGNANAELLNVRKLIQHYSRPK